ncbi:translocation/assembly module TamB domain-containing protein [Cardiobacteriaceae bacterium TAE3-ERU3]|nr:translocation/assembly module TamB domain-containing protein [Cardiobacteriaceae bacterium TAE3-ERU3]
MKNTVGFLLKSIKWLLLTLLLIVLLLVALLAYFTATETGYRQLPRVISALSPYKISYSSLEGHLWTRQSWRDFSLQGPGVDAHADALIIDNDSGFSPARVAFSQVLLSGADIDLQESTQPDDTSGGIPKHLPQIDLPFDVVLDEVRLDDVAVSQSGTSIIKIDHAELNARYQHGHLTSAVMMRSDLADAQLDVDLTTLEDYPLKLDAEATVHNLAEPQKLKIDASGSVLKPAMNIAATGYAELDATVAGLVELDKQQLDLKVDWQQLAVAESITSEEGYLRAAGPFEQLAISADAQLAGQDIPATSINGGAEVSANGAKDIHLDIGTLNGTVAFIGEVSFAPVISWQGSLTARDIDGSAYQKDLDLTLNADVVTEGELSSKDQHALLTINTLQGSWQGYPLNGDGTLRYANGRVNAQGFHLNIAENTITATGELGESNSALNVILDAAHLDNLTPAVDGNVNAHFLLSGDISNLDIDGALKWRDLSYTNDSGEQLLRHSNGDLDISGQPSALNLLVSTEASGRDFPPTQVEGKAVASVERIRDIDLQLVSGEGRAHVTGAVALKPDLAWDVNVVSEQFDPGRFVSDYPGSINANIDSSGVIASDGKIAVSATINELVGTLLNLPLTGNGAVHYDENSIRADNLLLNIAGNRVNANGELNDSDGQLLLDIDAAQLATLVPEMTGAVSGKATLSGVIDDPNINADLQWQNLSYTESESKTVLFESEQGTLQAKGNLEGLNVVTDLTASGRDFPQSHLGGRADVSQTEISNMDLQLTSGEGTAHVTGVVTLKPDIAWDVNVESQNFDPGRFASDYPGNINANIASNGVITSDRKIAAYATIHELNGTLLNQPLKGNGDIRFDKDGIRADNLLLNIAGNRISANGELNESGGELALDIDANQLGALVPGVAGAVSGKATLTGAIDDPTIDTDIQWQNLSYTDTQVDAVLFDSPLGRLQAEGNLDGLNVQTELTASGRDFPQSSLKGRAHVNQEQVSDIDLQLVSGKGTAHVTGSVAIQPDVSWDIKIDSKDFDPSRFVPDYPGNINANIASSGTISSDGDIAADMTINELGGSLLDYPLEGNGAVHYDSSGIRAENLRLNIANNRINANGVLDQSGGELALDIDAGQLGALVPGISGAVKGHASLTGAVNDPNIDADLQWQNLRYKDPDSNAVLFDSAQGGLQAKGNIDGLDVQTDLIASGRDFPQSRLSGGARVNPKRVNDIDLVLQQGDGRARLTGSADLQPEISWSIDLKTENFNPGAFVDGYEGKVNADIASEGKISKSGKLNANAEIKSISGTLNGEPLRGQGSVILENGSVSMQGMEVGLGENKFAVSGGVADGKFDMKFNIEGRNLSSLYKPLGGTFDAVGSIKGNAEQPEVDITASAKNIAYQDYRISSADVRLDSALRTGGALNNTINLSGVSLAGQQWQSIALNTEGKFDQHTIKFLTNGGEFNLDLAAQGGLKALDSWVGKITQLNATGDGLNWHLQQASALAVSPKSQKLDDFCLVDGISGLCVDVAHDQQTAITYRIDKLSPQSFAAFIPDMIRTTITAQGKGDVRIAANGQMSGQADITFTPGNIVIAPEDSAPVTLDLTKGNIIAAFKGQQANIASDIAFADAGELSLRTRISDFSAPKLDGQLAVNIPDIGEFRYLVPMVSDMRGSINGDLRFSGAASNPAVGGQIELAGGYIVIPEYATELSDIRLQLSAARTGKIDINGQVGTPRGALDINGALALAPVRLDLNLDGQNMLIADAENMRVVVTPSFDVKIDPDQGINVDGKVIIPEARVSIPDTSGGVSVSKDVVIVGKDDKSTQEKIKNAQTPFNASIAVELGDQVYFNNSDVNLRLIGGITVFMRPNRPITAEGTISVASGIYELYGQELDIKRGRVTFSGGNIANPTVEVLALREIADVQAGAQINGDVEHLHLTLTSNPAMPDSAILSYLLFGRAPDSGTDTDALLQTAASYTLGGVFPDNLAQETGLDVLDIGVTGMKAGKYLGDDLYVGMQSNFFTALTEFIARYQFSDRLKAEATASGQDNAIDFIYEFESN